MSNLVIFLCVAVVVLVGWFYFGYKILSTLPDEIIIEETED